MPNKQALVTAAFASNSNLPEDVVVNNFHFFNADADDISDDDGAQMAATVRDFYNSVHTPGTASIASFMSETLSGAIQLKVYDLGETAPRVPVHITNSTVTISMSGNPLPREVALCLSYKAAYESGHPQARYRGRLYLGPWNDAILVTGQPNTAIKNALKGAGTFLAGNTADTNEYLWSVRSQSDDVSRPIIDGWVDDAWDTQRRRGQAATVRETWAA